MCERAPGEGQSGAGSRAGTQTREKGRGDRRGVLLLAERARRGGGWRAGHGAARLFGVSSGSSLHRRQPPSPAKQPSGPDGCRGAKSTSSCSFPHAVPRHWGALPTHARAYRCTLPPEPEKKIKKSKPKDAGIGRARLAEVRRLRSPPSRGGNTAAGERGQVRQSVRRSPVRAGNGGRTCIRRTRRPCGLGHDSAVSPSSHVGSPGLGGGRGGARPMQEVRNSGSGRATGGGRKSSAAAQPRREAGPPQQSPRILR